MAAASLDIELELCSIENCQRSSATFCPHCEQDVCRRHFNEHCELLMQQLLILTDDINQLREKIAGFDLRKMLDEWRDSCIDSIGKIYEFKLRDIDTLKITTPDIQESIENTKANQSNGLTQLKEEISALVKDGEVGFDHLQILKRKFRQIQLHFHYLEYEHIGFDILISVSDPVSVYFIGGSLLNKFSQYKLNEFYGNRDQKWELIYKATRDGFNSKDFHQHCDNKGPTITVIQTDANSCLFGGFTSQSWSSPTESSPTRPSQTGSGFGSTFAFPSINQSPFSNQSPLIKYCYDHLAFLFTLVNVYQIHPRKFTIKEETVDYATLHCSNYGPCFGGTKESKSEKLQADILIESGGSLSSNFPNRYSDNTDFGSEIFLGEQNDRVTDLEVYRCLPYTTK